MFNNIIENFRNFHIQVRDVVCWWGKIRSTEKINYEPFLILSFVPVWQMIDFFISALNLGFEMYELPQVVAVHILGVGGSHLNLRHGDQDLQENADCCSKVHVVFLPDIVLSQPQLQMTCLSFPGKTNLSENHSCHSGSYDEGFFLLTKSFFTKKNHCWFEDKAHRVKLQTLKVGKIQ